MMRYEYARYSLGAIDPTEKMNKMAEDGWILRMVQLIPGETDRLHVLYEKEVCDHEWLPERVHGAELGTIAYRCAICKLVATPRTI